MRAAGLEPARPYGRRIFLPSTAFAALMRVFTRDQVCGLDYPFVVGLSSHPLRRRPSSLYTFQHAVLPAGLARDWHGQVPAFSFPRL